MYRRHDEVPVYEYRDTFVDANYYNHVLLALRRLGPEVRLAIPRLKTLDLILQHDAWIVVDRAFNDVPVIAWGDFEVSKRSSLHEPVKCRLRIYHASAGVILKRTLEAMELLLGELLAQEYTDESSSVLPFRRKDADENDNE